MTATYALVNVDNGDKYGRGTRTGPWSEETHQALLRLLACMEHDICGDCFDIGELISADDSETQAIGDGAVADIQPADESEIPGL